MIRRLSTQVNQMEFMLIPFTDQQVHCLSPQNTVVVNSVVEQRLTLQWQHSKEDRSNNYLLIVMYKILALWGISNFF